MTSTLLLLYLLPLAVSVPLGPAFVLCALIWPLMALYGVWEFARWMLVPQAWCFECGKWRGYPR